MKIILPFIWLFVIFIVLSTILFLSRSLLNIGIPYNQSAVLASGSFTISFIVMILFRRGYYLGEKSKLSYTLAAISLKFILYFILIIAVFFLSKNRSLEFIITFFVIYLSFTSFLMFSFIKLLKTKKTEK
jgi:hypothetical protein